MTLLLLYNDYVLKNKKRFHTIKFVLAKLIVPDNNCYTTEQFELPDMEGAVPNGLEERRSVEYCN